MFDNIIAKYSKRFPGLKGVKYESLNFEEREVINSVAKQLSTKPLTTEDLKKYIRGLISSVENELADIEKDKTVISFLFFTVSIQKNKDHDLFLKARLKNYLMIEGFLQSREKAKKQAEKYLENLANG